MKTPEVKILLSSLKVSAALKISWTKTKFLAISTAISKCSSNKQVKQAES